MTALSYKPGNSLLHKFPAWIKIIFIPLLNVFVFKMPFYAALSLLCLQLIVSLVLRFTVKEILKDLFPVIFYAVILYVMNFLIQIFSPDYTDLKTAVINVFINSKTAVMLLKLFCIMQSASIVFKTSTPLALREGCAKIESAVRKVLPVSKKNKFTNTVSFFICFIPLVFKNWNRCKRAWIGRGGKRGIKMYAAVFPAFFSAGIKQAYNMSRAVCARE